MTDMLNNNHVWRFSLTGESVWISVVSAEISSKEELLDALSESLNFPSYFGRNWDALSDCLRDFSWISQKRIFIFHMGFSKLPVDDLNAYIEVLRIAVDSWRNDGGPHELEILFPEEDSTGLANLLVAYH